MKERLIDRERAVPAHSQAPEVPEPGERALDGPASSVAPQRPAVLRRRFAAVRAVRRDQLDAALGQLSAQRVAVVAAVGDDPRRFLSRSARVMSAPYSDRSQRRFREPDFVRGRRVKEVPHRNSFAVHHHHPLRPLAPLGFPDRSATFFAEAKLPSRNASLHWSCLRSFSSATNVRQTFSQTPCSSQSRNRLQHVEGDGYSSGRSFQRAPLYRIQRMPSSTERLSAHGRPPRRLLRRRGSRGRIISHCASLNSRPYRGIRPPLTAFIYGSGRSNYNVQLALYPVMK